MGSTLRSVLLAIAAALLLVAVMLFVIFRFLLPAAAPEQPHNEPQFVIGSYDGQVAVFERGADYPMRVYDVSIAALPPEEQAKLQAGIPAADADALSVLLEDYTS